MTQVGEALMPSLCSSFSTRMSLRWPGSGLASGRNLGTRNSEMPLRAGRGVRQAGQHQMDDVLGQVVVAVGDEDLLAVDAVAVAVRLGAGAQGADIGARPAARSGTWRRSIGR